MFAAIALAVPPATFGTSATALLGADVQAKGALEQQDGLDEAAEVGPAPPGWLEFAAKAARRVQRAPTFLCLVLASSTQMGVPSAMNPLVFRCPQTGHPLDVGLDIHVHRPTLQSVQPITFLVHCPQCGHRHVWKLADGWLREPRREQRTGEWRPLA